MTDESALREIERLRDRAHDHANLLQAHSGQIEAVDERLKMAFASMDSKLDAIHLSLKEDLAEIKTETKATNGRVGRHDREISTLQGGVIVMAAGLPVVTGLLLFTLDRIVG